MKKMTIFTVIATLALTTVAALSCAPPETSNSEGVEYVGCRLKVTEIDPLGFAEDLLDGDTVAPAVSAPDATLELLPYCQSCSTEYCSDVNITGRTISYTPRTANAPALASRFFSIYAYIAVDGSFTNSGIPIVTEGLKEEYLVKGGDPTVETFYDVTIEYEGETDNGEDVSASGTAYVRFKDY